MRLKANKTSLYNLVATYKPLPGMRRVDFQKANGRPDYWLEWTTDDGHTKAFLSSSLGHPILTITTHDAAGGQLYHEAHRFSVEGLRERGMVEEVTTQTTQGVRISAVEDDLAVYRAAVSARELKQAAAEIKAAKERRTARAAERERKARRRNKVLAFIALALFVAVCVVMVAKAYSEEPAAEPAAPEASAAPAAILPTELLFTAAEEEYMEDPQETEKIEEALLAQGYFSLAVPMPYEWQDYMRTYCEEYGCPYPLALAVAQTESNFDMDAVGASGEVGIMQLNPGPGGSYHAEIQAATGLDPTTASGNIAGGCYKLGLYLAKYGNVEKAAMAYNMGEGGARSAWDSGITSTDYSKAVKEAMETWECTVNAWGGV